MLGYGKYGIISSDEIRKELWGSLRAAHDVTPEVKKERNGEVWDRFYRRVEESLEHNVDTVADATNLRSSARGKLLEIAQKTKSQGHVIVFNNLGQARERNEARDLDLVVPREVMSDFIRQFESAYTALVEIPHGFDSVTVIGNLR